jgi:hypothetical protein
MVCVLTGVADPLWAGGPRRAVLIAQQQLCSPTTGGGACAVTARSATGGIGLPAGLWMTRPRMSAIRAQAPAMSTASADVNTCIAVMVPSVAMRYARP